MDLNTAERRAEWRVRARARRHGYRVTKSRARQSLDNFGLFMVIDQSSNFVVFGVRFDASAEEIDQWLDDDDL